MATLEEFILDHEPMLRLACFAGVLLAMMLWEGARPLRQRLDTRGRRWSINLGLVFIDTLAVRFLMPIVPAVMAEVAADKGWGLLNMSGFPAWVSFVIAFLVLDFAIYLQHMIFHKVPVLWRLHRMHHSDMDFDTTTGVRFHPIEILLSIAIKLAIVTALGVPVMAVIVFEIVLNATSLFNHGNIALPRPVERVVKAVFVTPDMHRIHHSVHREETDSNYGFNFSFWDRLCGTYRARPKDPQEDMVIGLNEYRDAAELSLPGLLVQPFKNP